MPCHLTADFLPLTASSLLLLATSTHPAGEEHRGMLTKILKSKAGMQALVQELLVLRAAAKEQRAASAGGAASSVGAGAASGSLGGAAGTSLLSSGGCGNAVVGADAERRLQERLHVLAGLLRDVSKPEEGMSFGCGLLHC